MATGSPSASQLEAPIEARPEVKVVVRPERVYEHLNFIAEYIEQYQPGGYHPVFLNDTYQNDGYRILKKLGEGAYSTVWLAKDTRKNRYVAMKFMKAKVSEDCKELKFYEYLSRVPPGEPGYEYISHMLDTFTFNGPNGTHRCLVLEVLGPDLQKMLDKNPRFAVYFDCPHDPHWDFIFPQSISREVCSQAVQGLGFLHKHGITHGDIQQGNILFTVPDLSPFPEHVVVPRPPTEDEFLEEDRALPIYERRPFMQPVKRVDGSAPSSSAPPFIIESQALNRFASCEPGFKIKISDFSGSFWSSDINERPVTPVALRPPELWLSETWNEKIDIWNLGAVIYQVVTGHTLFDVMGFAGDEETRDSCLAQMLATLGPFPESLSSKWPKHAEYTNADGTLNISQFPYMSQDRPPATLEELCQGWGPEDASEDDMYYLSVMLRAMLSYNPQDRPTPEELMKFEWWTDRPRSERSLPIESPPESPVDSPVEPLPVEARPVETQAIEARPVEAGAMEARPVETLPQGIRPVEAPPVHTLPVEARPVETLPHVGTRPVEAPTVQTLPVEASQVEAPGTSVPPRERPPSFNRMIEAIVKAVKGRLRGRGR